MLFKEHLIVQGFNLFTQPVLKKVYAQGLFPLGGFSESLKCLGSACSLKAKVLSTGSLSTQMCVRETDSGRKDRERR